jgi:hypothetical protein
MLHEAGLLWTECDKISLVDSVPPQGRWKNLFTKDTPVNRIPSPKLQAGIEKVTAFIEQSSYDVIITFGEVAFWSLTNNKSHTKWRGSFLEYGNAILIPTYHPRDVQRVWEWRYIAVHDLGKAAQVLKEKPIYPAYNFIVRPDYQTALETLRELLCKVIKAPTLVSVDIETRLGHIACVGFGWSKFDALCIPLMCVNNPKGYWSLEEEFVLVKLMSTILLHPNCLIIGQNFIYDEQYFARFWGILPKVHFDTMLAQAVCYPGLPKALDFISSLYCEYHRFWKSESKNWDPKLGEDQLWIYNCKDCVVTFEGAEVLQNNLEHLNLVEQFQFEMDLIEPVLYMMLRGNRIDLKARDAMFWELSTAAQEREEWFESMFPDLKLAKSKTAKPWYRSPIQQQKLFYEVFNVPVVREKGRPTANDKALTIIGKKEPLLYPICKALAEYRSIGVFLSTFIQAPLDQDKRLRCSYNPVGTETFRFNSSADAFGLGTNLQNIPKGG